MKELYSRPLSDEARAKLIDFVEAYLNTLLVAEVDEKMDIAKQKAMEVLGTDIDIAIFGATFVATLTMGEVTKGIQSGRWSPRVGAELLVEAIEVGRVIDASGRPGITPQ